jgi:hypothetical protein
MRRQRRTAAAPSSEAAGSRDGRNLGPRQGEGDRLVDPILLVERLIPGGVPALRPLGPGPAGDRLDDAQRDIPARALRGQGIKVVPVLRVRVEDEVVRREHRVEVEAAQCLQVHGRRLVAVAGDADGADQSGVAGLQGRLERATGTGGPVELGHVAHGVELDQVQAVDPQALQRPADLLRRLGPAPLSRLRGEKDLGAALPLEAGHRRPHAHLRLAV